MGIQIVSILQVPTTYLIFLIGGNIHFPSLTLTIIKMDTNFVGQGHSQCYYETLNIEDICDHRAVYVNLNWLRENHD